MIRYYSHRVFGASEIVAPLLQGLDDSEEFSVVNVIVSFGGGEGGRMISAGMKVSVGVLLHEYSSRGSEGGVGHDKERFGHIWHLDHRCG